MSSKVYIGVDPGLDGAFVAQILDGEQVVGTSVHVMPTIGQTNRDVDSDSLQRLFLQFVELSNNGTCHLILENVLPLQGLMAKGNWSLCRTKTYVEAYCQCYGIPYTRVHSKTWQKEMWSGVTPIQTYKGKTKKGNPSYETDTKGTSLLAAQKLFPNFDFTPTERAWKPHSGIVDALLLSEYGKRKNL